MVEGARCHAAVGADPPCWRGEEIMGLPAFVPREPPTVRTEDPAAPLVEKGCDPRIEVWPPRRAEVPAPGAPTVPTIGPPIVRPEPRVPPAIDATPAVACNARVSGDPLPPCI